METLQNSHIQLAGTQEPLLHKRQIIPGVLLTGRMAAHIWKVLEIEESIVTCIKMPTSGVWCGHHYAPVTGGGETCVCGARQQPINDFLPLKKGKARFHVISLSDGLVNVPKEHTIYAYLLPNNTVKTIIVKNGKWSEPVPLVPALHKVWELPDALRAMCDDTARVYVISNE